MSIGDEFEKLIERGEISFHPASLDDLCPWGRNVVRNLVCTSNVSWQLGDTKVGNNYCVKLDDSYLQYLDIMPDTLQFMWCTDDHHDSVHPDVASAYLLAKNCPGMRTRVWRDDSTGLRVMEIELPDGRKIRADDIIANGERTISFKQM